MSIIELLNQSCSHCHRKEYSQRIFTMLGEFKGNLKDLAIGKQPLRISYWVHLLDICPPFPIQKTQLPSTIASKSPKFSPTTISSTNNSTIYPTARLSSSTIQLSYKLRKSLNKRSRAHRIVSHCSISFILQSSYLLYLYRHLRPLDASIFGDVQLRHS